MVRRQAECEVGTTKMVESGVGIATARETGIERLGDEFGVKVRSLRREKRGSVRMRAGDGEGEGGRKL